jgi:hypothetical protein
MIYVTWLLEGICDMLVEFTVKQCLFSEKCTHAKQLRGISPGYSISFTKSFCAVKELSKKVFVASNAIWDWIYHVYYISFGNCRPL